MRLGLVAEAGVGAPAVVEAAVVEAVVVEANAPSSGWGAGTVPATDAALGRLG